MSKDKKNFLISLILVSVAIIFTVLVKVVDVKPVGVNSTDIGFSTINVFVFKSIGVNNAWYNITDWLGIISILIAVVYAVIGIIQLIKRKSIFKIDKEIIILGLFYVVVLGLYVFFEKVVINYRPVLMEGLLEASYPSSHTLMTICICGSAIITNKKLFDSKIVNYLNIISFIIILGTVIGRLMSGVHWFSDIVGGVLISSALLMIFYSVINKEKKSEIK